MGCESIRSPLLWPAEGEIAARAADGSSSLMFRSLSTGARREILHVEKAIDLGLAVSPDHRYLLYSQLDYFGSNLMLAENFR
jgi:hypothetical protein